MSRRRQKGRQINGLVILDKAGGASSNNVLQQVKRLYDANKAGHTGSLDPLATGVLPLCLGEATKVSQFLLDADKQYRARIKLGVRTDSGDSEGEVIAEAATDHLTEDKIKQALRQFEGDIEQLPPMYSALKRDGVPLYKLARQGITVEREPRPVTIYRIELTDYHGDEIEIEVDCSKGTYIRTIADDLGEALECGGHIVSLRRTKAGVFTEADSVSIETLTAEKEQLGLEALDQRLIAMDEAINDLPEVRLPDITASQIKHGQAVMVRHLPADGLVRMYDEEQFIGIGFIDDDGKVAPRRLINTAE
ncbi:MAG: tRNA pseudouridine(55) synthase TruB [Gammaproteobacteria bacterium]